MKISFDSFITISLQFFPMKILFPFISKPFDGEDMHTLSPNTEISSTSIDPKIINYFPHFIFFLGNCIMFVGI